MPYIFTTKPYEREKAVAYAHRWAYGRNPAFYDFEELGGDCTNFASQCIYTGSGVMNYTPTYGWYYINASKRAPAWTGVPYLYNFLTENENGSGPFGREVSIWEIKPGDICQMDIDNRGFHHNPVIMEVGLPPNPDNILVAAHSYDADYRPLSSYNYLQIRFVHIDGVRLISQRD